MNQVGAMTPIISKRQRFGYVLGAIAVPPIVFDAYLRATYWLSGRHGMRPLQYFPHWWWYAVFGVCLAAGLVAICYGTRGRIWLQVLLGLAYLPLMAAALFFFQLAIGCGNGDCL